MSTNDVIARLFRLYAAVDALVEGDLSKFPPIIRADAQRVTMLQDFVGGLTPAELSNLAHSLIHNLANLQDHLRRWAKKNSHDPGRVDKAVSASPELQIIIDLSNNDKHGYPPRDGGRSGKAPKLAKIERVLRLSTAAEAGSSVAITFAPAGPKQVSGTGSAAVVITAEVVDAGDTVIGHLDDIAAKALLAWEQLLQSLGIST